jgi:predicted HicB family RNase H-like nuclease
MEELAGGVIHGADDVEAIGNWVQRGPRSLHLQLTKAARAEGVSLNQMVTSILAQQVNSRTVSEAIK